MGTSLRSLVLGLSFAILLASGGPIVAQSAPSQIPVTDLGTLGGTSGTTQVTAMNDLGMVVGYSVQATGYHAFAWTAVDGFMDIGTLPGGTSSYAYGVNDLGQVVGGAVDPSGYYLHAFVWTKAGGLVDLGTGPNGYSAAARAINSKGQVAGDFDSNTAPTGRHAFFWSPSTGMKDLGSLGGQFLMVSGMNSGGTVVGYATTPAPEGYTHAFLVKASSSSLKDLGTLGGTTSSASGINDAGQIVGSAQLATGQSHAFIYKTKMVDIGTPGAESFATAINANGQVVGQINSSAGRHAFSYTASGGMIDLGTLGDGDSRATAVNRNGQVTGVSGTRTFRDHAFLWSASTGMLDAGSPDDLSSQGVAINSSGQLAGTFVSNNNDTKGFFLDPTSGRTNIKDKGWSRSTAVAVNGSGMVVGQSLDPLGYTRAFVWTVNGGMFGIYTPTGYHSSAVGVNDAGQIIGHYNLANYYTQGFLWSASTGFVPITGGGYLTTLVAINQAGQIAGYGVDPGGQNRAFLRNADGTQVTISPPGGGGAMQPQALNDSGIVVGSFLSNGSYHAFFWTAGGGSVDLGAVSAVAINKNGDYTGTFTNAAGQSHAYLKKANSPLLKDLGALASTESTGTGINAAAEVIGNSGAQDGPHGVFYDTRLRDMGSLGGGSVALALNDSGQAVGWSYTTAGQQHAFLWTKGPGIRDLGTLGGAYSKAVAINGPGQAVGEANLTDDSLHAVLWTTR